MTEFTKLKIGFALALLGTLFALHPFLDRFADLGFVYLGSDLRLFHAYAATSGLLGLCVYGYALALMSNRSHSRFEKAGNHSYALAVLVLPIFGGLFLSAKLAERVAVSHVAWAAPAVAVGTGCGWLVLSQIVAWRLRGRLGDQDRVAKLAQLARQEAECLGRAREMFHGEHFDLCVVEAWRAMESRLRQVLLSRRVVAPSNTADAILRAAVRRDILPESARGMVDDLKRAWLVALSTEPLPREVAAEAMRSVRHVLAVVPGPPITRPESPDRDGRKHATPPPSRARAASSGATPRGVEQGV